MFLICWLVCFLRTFACIWIIRCLFRDSVFSLDTYFSRSVSLIVISESFRASCSFLILSLARLVYSCRILVNSLVRSLVYSSLRFNIFVRKSIFSRSSLMVVTEISVLFAFVKSESVTWNSSSSPILILFGSSSLSMNLTILDLVSFSEPSAFRILRIIGSVYLYCLAGSITSFIN